MILRPDVISKAIEANFNKDGLDTFTKICFSAKGKNFSQNDLIQNKSNQNFILLKVDSEAALRKANRRFEGRVRAAETAARGEDSELEWEDSDRLDERWKEAKRKERTNHDL